MRRAAFSNVGTFLDTRSESSIDLYLGLDREFRSSLENRSGGILYNIMFYVRCRECASGEPLVQWSRLKFPVGPGDFSRVCHPGNYRGFDPEASMQLSAAFGLAGNLMFDEFDRIYKETKRNDPSC